MLALWVDQKKTKKKSQRILVIGSYMMFTIARSKKNVSQIKELKSGSSKNFPGKQRLKVIF